MGDALVEDLGRFGVVGDPGDCWTGQDQGRVTAATASVLFGALLGDAPAAVHVPAPGGLPGGYPVLASGLEVRLDLPWPLERARAVNEAAARWDGIERIDPDGTVTLTEAAAGTLRDVLGYEAGPLRPADASRAAEELRRRFRAYVAGQG